jgi:hypothetical protein
MLSSGFYKAPDGHLTDIPQAVNEQGHSMVVDGNLTPLGYEKITGLSAVKALTVPTGARVALLQAEGQNVRWRDDGVNPTATDGMLLKTTADRWYTGDLAALRLVETAASATVMVSYYR